VSVISIETARDHVNAIGTSQDDYIQSCIDAAESHAEQYMGRTLEPWIDGEAEGPVPADVKRAILLLVGDYYNNREATVVGVSVANNPAAESLMHFRRRGMGI